MLKRTSLLLPLLAGLLSCRFAPVEIWPEDPDLHARVERLSGELEKRRQELHIPGMAIAVIQDDRVILARGFGLADVQSKRPATTETIFAIGSTTKAFTSMLVAMLADEGKMNWDDPVRKHIPYFKLLRKRANKQVQIRDLLCHRTGLTRMGILWAGNQATREEMLRQVAEARPLAPYGTAFLYNNVMYVAAGVAAGNAADSDWETLIRDRIFEPLGMRDTVLSVKAALEDPRTANGYVWDEVEEEWDDLPMRPIDTVGPAGSINSNVLEMSRWVRFLLRRGTVGDERLVRQEQFDEMWKKQNAIGPGVDYGYGWMLRKWNDMEVMEHGGGIDGFGAQVALLPEKNAGFVLLVNVTSTPLLQESINRVWEALFGEAEKEVATGKGMSPDELKPYLGRFHFARLKADVTVLMKENRLAVDVPGQTVYTLHWPDDEGKWVFELTDEVAVSFEKEGDKVPSMIFYQSGMEFKCPRSVPPKDLPSVDEILKLVHVEKAPRSVRITGEIKFLHQGVTGRMTVLSEGTDRSSAVVDFGRFGSIRTVVNGDRAWAKEFNLPVEELDGALLEQVRFEDPLILARDWRTLFEKIEVVGKDKVGKEEVWVVRTKPKNLPASTKHISAKTGLILKEELPQVARGVGHVLMTIRYQDYRDVGGFKIPFKSLLSNPTMGRMIVTLEKADADIDFPEGTFWLKDD